MCLRGIKEAETAKEGRKEGGAVGGAGRGVTATGPKCISWQGGT